jgi:Xaa-Pro aminopeptidase
MVEEKVVNSADLAAAKRAQAAALLSNAALDGWLLVSPDGRDPAVPLVVPGSPVCQRGFFLITQDGRCRGAVTSADALELRETDGLVLETYVQDDRQAVRSVLGQLGKGRRRIAINDDAHDPAWSGLSLGRLRWLEQILAEVGAQVQLVSARAVLAPLRSVKTEEELRRLRRAADLAVQVVEDVRPTLKIGLSERAIHRLFSDAIRAYGIIPSGDGIIVGLSTAGYTTHHEPTERVAQPGDELMVDFGVVFEGYASDISRTFYYLRPDESEPPFALRAVFDTHRQAVDAALSLLRPGVFGWEVDAVARVVVRNAGLPGFEHALGHQVGRLAHDGGTLLAPRWPRFGEAPDGRLREGEVYTLEPTIITEDGRVCQIEEEVLITRDRPVVLTRRQEAFYCV